MGSPSGSERTRRTGERPLSAASDAATAAGVTSDLGRKWIRRGSATRSPEVGSGLPWMPVETKLRVHRSRGASVFTRRQLLGATATAVVAASGTKALSQSKKEITISRQPGILYMP